MINDFKIPSGINWRLTTFRPIFSGIYNWWGFKMMCVLMRWCFTATSVGKMWSVHVLELTETHVFLILYTKAFILKKLQATGTKSKRKRDAVPFSIWVAGFASVCSITMAIATTHQPARPQKFTCQNSVDWLCHHIIVFGVFGVFRYVFLGLMT